MVSIIQRVILREGLWANLYSAAFYLPQTNMKAVMPRPGSQNRRPVTRSTVFRFSLNTAARIATSGAFLIVPKVLHDVP